MDYRTLISRLGEGTRAAFLFETFVLRLLSEHVSVTGKTLKVETAPGRRFVGDAIAPRGIDNLPGPTLVEIRRSTRIPSRFLLDQLGRILKVGEFASVLLIVGDEFGSRPRGQFLSTWADLYPSIPIAIWDAERLSELMGRYAANVEPLVSQLATLRLQDVIRRPDVDWKSQREDRLSAVVDAYASSSLSLFLGAGVSIAGGLPAWGTLLDSLFVNFLTRTLTVDSEVRDAEIEQFVGRLKNLDDPSPLMTARYLRRGLVDPSAEGSEEFQIAVTEVLYRDAPDPNAAAPALLGTLARMTHPRRSGAKVKAVVTFNFDDLLECELERTGDFYKSIFREADLPTHDELPIYHVHGFLPRDRSKYDNLGDGILVLAEEGYHELYSDTYHWSNLVQLNLLRESTCLFVGLSLADPNLRRLLEIAARRGMGTPHFAFVQRMSEDAFTQAEGKTVVKARKRSVQEFLRNHHRINEELFRELGVSLIWFEEFDDIPELLNKIQK